MDKFIIEYKSRVNGEDVITYHVDISVTDPKRGAMNVYTEHISTINSQARIFYSRQEAEQVSSLFSSSLHTPSIIKK